MSFFFFFLGKREKPNNFLFLFDCFYKLFREDTSKGSLILNLVLWELKLVGHPKPVTGDTTLFIQKPGEAWPLLSLKSPHAAHVSETHPGPGQGGLEGSGEYFRGTCRPAEDSRPPKPPTHLHCHRTLPTSLPRVQLLVFKLLIERKNKYEHQSRKREF